jgi:hypothetical protein
MENHWRSALLQAPLMALLGACASAPPPSVEELPAALRVPPTAVLTREIHATGVQIYTCRAAKDDAARFEWQLKAPEAELYDKAGKKIGRHYAGPTWEANDGSKVSGELIARVSAPDSTAIAWLLVGAKSTSGKGLFCNVQFIQRLHTAGGNAPPGGCDQAAAGSDVRVAYAADYWFYAGKQ